MAEEPPKQDLKGTGHESRDLNARAIFLFAAGLVVTVTILFFVIGSLFNRFSAKLATGRQEDRAAPNVSVPEPRLQSNPAADMEKFRAHEKKILSSYGWVNRTAGVVRIPIERAMDLVVERGFQPPPESFGKTPLQMQQEKAATEKSSP
jgi:hypothetical protein